MLWNCPLRQGITKLQDEAYMCCCVDPGRNHLLPGFLKPQDWGGSCPSAGQSGFGMQPSIALRMSYISLRRKNCPCKSQGKGEMQWRQFPPNKQVCLARLGSLASYDIRCLHQGREDWAPLLSTTLLHVAFLCAVLFSFSQGLQVL